MTKDTLLDMSKTLNTEYEIGIWLETRDFLERQDLTTFSIKYTDGQYNLVIKLKKFSLDAAKTIFISLVRFIEYRSTFYVREDTRDAIQYFLLSSMDSKKAFLFHIVFE
ncbi:hypothetical protein YDYSY3_02510 [Paenibacillus chitinolyticus]|uniref:hypothetical protein n=1 Tax=Paenibacillus chitinolyticus TaxID=79263 RepID=UPI0026E4A8D9|nr:hypothetical protein [Paenibacillus chitinolyticus]GKS09251.1 hypothetical protein YDYSY3_02510 [Paenibacillus chitinolyticus]